MGDDGASTRLSSHTSEWGRTGHGTKSKGRVMGQRARRALLALAVGATLLAVPAAAEAVGEPTIDAAWVTDVTSTSANLRASINANGLSTTYRFEYVTQAAFEASGFASARKAPLSGSALLGSASTPIGVVQHVDGLSPVMTYRYRVVATNSASPPGGTIGPEHALTTQENGLVFHLSDNRGWEMVSLVDKGGGAIAAPGALFGGGDLQAAATGGAVTYGSSTSFGEAAGSPPASQYVSRRSASGWTTENVSAPLESAVYGNEPDGAPYRVFSLDLGQGLLFGGLPCRGGLPGCPAPTPVLPGSGAPPGYMAYYRRDSAGGYTSLLTAADLAHTAVSSEAFSVSLATVSPDLAHVVLSSCAKLTANAIEVPAGPGECSSSAQNLYEWSAAGLSLVNLLPGDTTGTPGAQIAAPLGAISANGGRVYFSEGGNLYLREGGTTVQVDLTLGGGGTFQTASADGAVAFFTREVSAGDHHLYRYLAGGSATDLTPSGGVAGVLGASADGSYVYFQDAGGLKLWHSGSTTTVAPVFEAAKESDYLTSVGTARVSADGLHLAFLSDVELNHFDNAGQTELYLYGPPPGGGAARLICASCNPTGERPRGSTSIPGVQVNGSTAVYKPRVLSADGTRLFFDSSDALVLGDSNSRPDVYEWEAQVTGDCNRPLGCVAIVSGGRSSGGTFVDASADGSDAYFLTGEALVSADPGSTDLYDARVDGGFATPRVPIACIGDACQALPAPPDDPDPGTLTKNSGNPPLQYFKQKKHSHKKKHRHHPKKGHRKHGGRSRR